MRGVLYGWVRWRMFKRRDIPPVLLLLLLIVLVMLTLSQILVVHNGRYGGRSVHNIRKLQLELREMDINLHSLMLQNVPSIELNRRLLQNQINAERIAAIIRQAAEPQLTTKRTDYTDQDQDLRQDFEQENYQSHLSRVANHLPSHPGRMTGNTDVVSSRQEATLLNTKFDAVKLTHATAQQSLQSQTQQHITDNIKSNSSLNEAVPNVTPTVLTSANQLDHSNRSSMHYSQRRHPESSNNTNSSSGTDSIHKQNHPNNVANTFHLDQRNSSDDRGSRTITSVNNMATKHTHLNSSSLDHYSRIVQSITTQHEQKVSVSGQSSKESPLTQKTQQMSQSRKVLVDTTQRALNYCPSIPPGLRK